MLAGEGDGALRFGEVGAGDHEFCAAGCLSTQEDGREVWRVGGFAVVYSAVHCITQVDADLDIGVVRGRGSRGVGVWTDRHRYILEV